jgi:hypothetical protein
MRFIIAIEHIDWSIGYIVIIIIYIIAALLSHLYKNNSYFLLGGLFLIICIAGTRSIVNYDMVNYKIFYKDFQSLHPGIIEPGFIFLCWIGNIFTDNVHFLFFLYSLLQITFFYLAIKNYTPYIKTSFFFFLLIPSLFLFSLIGIRQALAEAIFFYATSFLVNKKDMTKFYIFSFIAILFHYSAISVFLISLIVFYGIKKQINFFLVLILITITFIIHFLNLDIMILNQTISNLSPIIPAKYQLYISNILNGVSPLKGWSLYSLLLFNIMLVSALFLMNYKYIYNNHKKDKSTNQYTFVINLLIIGTILNNLFGSYADVTARIYYYFIYYYTVLIPTIIYQYTTKKEKLILIYCFSIFLFFWFFSSVYNKIPGIENPPLIYKNYILQGDDILL